MALVASPPVKPCPICKSQRFVAAASGADWAARADDDRRQVLAVAREHGWTPDFHINRCDDCGFLALSPMPDAAWLGRFYGGYYASPAYDAKRHRKIRRSRRRLARLAPFVQGGDFLDVGCNLGFACAAAIHRLCLRRRIPPWLRPFGSGSPSEAPASPMRCPCVAFRDFP